MSTALFRLWHRLSRTLVLAHATLREIFDESAYARFLARHHAASSSDAYSAFLHEQADVRNRRHRCC
jgi:hypothetical protein